MDSDTRSRLNEYINLVIELNSLRLARGLLSAGTISIRGTGNFENARIINFDEEDCRSFLLSCRMLIQDNDRISVRCIGQIIQEGDFSEECKTRVEGERFRLNLSLDDYCPLLSSGGVQMTNRDLLETFLWGSYAHRGMNPVIRTRFQEWQSDAAQFLHLKSVFLLMLKMMLEAATRIGGFVSDELNQQEAEKAVP